MGFKGIVTGNLGADPDIRYTPAGKAVCSFSVAATAQRKDQQSGQWSDDGAPLWIRVSLWERMAEIAADTLNKGDRVSVEGTLVLREYDRNDGGKGLSYELAGARLLGVIPKPAKTGSTTGAQPPSGGNGWGQPTNVPNDGFPAEAPF